MKLRLIVHSLSKIIQNGNILILYREESDITYKVIWSKKRKIFRRTDQINILIGMYKEAKSNLINNECNRNEIIELWFECLNILNSNFINLISI
ncbi:hypothetical protein BCR32DRAFT_285678 [Anaeromyces robustus]|uniref:Uncharacterized protein n=1 Tax=Anaeromyces robustus TaxID=1754192 RepID=A0A1Y1WIQ1_9FUNG|nr:hypothetical protein BCR32DRAFT_285678 [Anaeromyces robustus]|eukprot:ORX73417.1 hypothetical protein BCR32DRAFT_285678 [Anaeromyces robustus]